jgi:hypothetical protein
LRQNGNDAFFSVLLKAIEIEEDNSSGLNWLCRQFDGRVLLDKLITVHPTLLKNEAFISALCLPLPAAAELDENKTDPDFVQQFSM